MTQAVDFLPRLLGAAAAAQYLGISVSTLYGLGIRPRQLGKRRLYDRLDLDAFASGLPYDGQEDADTCENVFGVAS